MKGKNVATVSSGATARSTGEGADHQARNLRPVTVDREGRDDMKRTILIVGLLMALLTAIGQWNFVGAKVPVEFDEGAQLGSAYPEITHWPADEIVSADVRIDEGAQLGSAYPEIKHWPDPVMRAGSRLHISRGE